MNGIVLKSTGSWYTVLSDQRDIIECRIKGVFRTKEIKSTNPVAVGDHVSFELEENGKGVIYKIAERKNYIVRKSINLSKQSHILASNIDQAFLVVTMAFPKTSTGFIDRFLLTAEAYHIPVILLFNKQDIFKEDEQLIDEQHKLIAMYSNIGYQCYSTSMYENESIQSVKKISKDKITLVAGHSGVGKSSLINAMDAELKIKTGEISSVHLKGKHTTTFAEMHPLSYGGFIIDIPGIKELGLIDMQKEEIAGYFPEFRAIKTLCRFNNCLHVNEPQCAVRKAAEEGEIAASRYNNYLGIINGEELKIAYS